MRRKRSNRRRRVPAGGLYRFGSTRWRRRRARVARDAGGVVGVQLSRGRLAVGLRFTTTPAFAILACSPLRFCMSPSPRDAVVVARHAPDTLVRLGENEFLDLVRAGTASEAVGMVGFVACTVGSAEEISKRRQGFPPDIVGDLPVTIASLWIGFWQIVHMYEQFSQTGLPSESRSRFVLCSTRQRHLAQRLRSESSGRVREHAKVSEWRSGDLQADVAIVIIETSCQ